MGQTKHICRPNPVLRAPVNNLFQNILALKNSCLAIEIILKYQLFEDLYSRAQIWTRMCLNVFLTSLGQHLLRRIQRVSFFPIVLFNLRSQNSRHILEHKHFLHSVPLQKDKELKWNLFLKILLSYYLYCYSLHSWHTTISPIIHHQIPYVLCTPTLPPCCLSQFYGQLISSDFSWPLVLFLY